MINEKAIATGGAGIGFKILTYAKELEPLVDTASTYLSVIFLTLSIFFLLKKHTKKPPNE